MSQLESKVIIVTGALGAIGGATAGLLAQAGARLVLTDISDTGGSALAERLSAEGGEASFFAADLVDEDQARALVDHAVSRFGRLDGAFNNAGVAQNNKPIIEMTSAEWTRVLQINATSMFHCVKHQMIAMKDGGSIVNTSSGLGVIAIPNAAEYIASKHAVCGLTRAAAVEGAPMGIRVNTVLPGAVRTPLLESTFDTPEKLDQLNKLHPIGRTGEPEEIGNLVRWLLSDEASFITGSLYAVDGGYTMV